MDIVEHIISSRGSLREEFSPVKFTKMVLKKTFCSCLKSKRCRKKKKDVSKEEEQNERSGRLFDNAESMFMQELDVLNLIRTVRMAKVFAGSVMSRRQKVLLRFQKHNLIESGTEKSALSSEDMLLEDLKHKN